MGGPQQSLLFEPAASTWRELMARWPIDAEAAGFREQLGLGADRPIVMSGHQAGVWHPGIVAKWFACVAAGRARGADPVWLVVDQDENDPAEIAYPVRTRGGLLERRVWRLGEPIEGVCNAMRAPIEPGAVPTPDDGSFASGAVGVGLGRVFEAVGNRAKEGTLARQFAFAAADLLAPLCDGPALVFATAIGRTDAFRRTLEAMQSEASACARAYNAAAETHRDAGVRPMRIDEAGGSIELPAWDLTRSTRRPVFAGDRELHGDPAPRALLMTALVRSFGCELFIHGSGGGGDNRGYDRVTDDWWSAWRGRPPRAPTVMATATRTLDIAGAEIPSPGEIAESRSRAHRARHDPAIVGDEDAAEAKHALLAKVDSAKRRGEDPGPLFREMQELLRGYRQRRAVELSRLDTEAERLQARADEALIAHDRTWAFPLYPDAALESLRDEVFAAFGVR